MASNANSSLILLGQLWKAERCTVLLSSSERVTEAFTWNDSSKWLKCCRDNSIHQLPAGPET